MSRKNKILTIILAVVVLLLLLLAFWLFWFKKPATVKVVVTNQQTNTVVTPRESSNSNRLSTTTNQQIAQQSGLVALATAFAERYGSFSSESNMTNLQDLFGSMSSNLQTETEDYIASAKPSATYYGVTTRVLSVEVSSLDDAAGTAEVSVSTQREESNGSPQNSSIKYQTLLLKYVKEAGLWKVNTATWQ